MGGGGGGLTDGSKKAHVKQGYGQESEFDIIIIIITIQRHIGLESQNDEPTKSQHRLEEET